MRAKIFAGVRLNMEMKELLDARKLEKILYEGKEYVGLYLGEHPSLEELRKGFHEVHSILHAFLPEQTYRLKILFFPQEFVG